MDIGIGSFSYPWAIGVPGQPRLDTPLEHFGLLEAGVALGVRRVQYVDNLPLTALSPESLNELVARAKAANIVIEVGMRGTDREGLLEHLRLAQKTGSPFVRVMPDKGDDKPSAPEIVRRLQAVEEMFADAGVTIAWESHERIPVATLHECVQGLGPNVRVCLDTTNSWGALETPAYVVATLASLTCNLHLKDFVVKRVPSQLGFLVEGVPSGQGVLDVPHILSLLPSHCSITHEQWTPWQDTIEQTVALEREWTRESIKFLQGTAGQD